MPLHGPSEMISDYIGEDSLSEIGIGGNTPFINNHISYNLNKGPFLFMAWAEIKAFINLALPVLVPWLFIASASPWVDVRRYGEKNKKIKLDQRKKFQLRWATSLWGTSFSSVTFGLIAAAYSGFDGWQIWLILILMSLFILILTWIALSVHHGPKYTKFVNATSTVFSSMLLFYFIDMLLFNSAIRYYIGIRIGL